MPPPPERRPNHFSSRQSPPRESPQSDTIAELFNKLGKLTLSVDAIANHVGIGGPKGPSTAFVEFVDDAVPHSATQDHIAVYHFDVADGSRACSSAAEVRDDGVKAHQRRPPATTS